MRPSFITAIPKDSQWEKLLSDFGRNSTKNLGAGADISQAEGAMTNRIGPRVRECGKNEQKAIKSLRKNSGGGGCRLGRFRDKKAK
jgi:hypothetical protein